MNDMDYDPPNSSADDNILTKDWHRYRTRVSKDDYRYDLSYLFSQHISAPVLHADVLGPDYD